MMIHAVSVMGIAAIFGGTSYVVNLVLPDGYVKELVIYTDSIVIAIAVVRFGYKFLTTIFKVTRQNESTLSLAI